MEVLLQSVADANLKHCLAFGIGLHHAGLRDDDRKLVETLFVEQKIQVLVCTSTLAWGVNFPAHLVVIKGTEYYDPKTKRYVDFPITDVLQMMGRAGRPQYDTEARACILVHEPKKNFYKKFLYEPFPVESSLAEQLHNHINAEIVSGTLTCIQDAIDYLTWTYFFRRLIQNPSYYHVDDNSPETINNFLNDIVYKTLTDLEMAGCIRFSESDVNAVEPLTLGRIASFYYLKYTTVAMFHRRLVDRMEIPAILDLLTSAAEYDDLPVRHNEEYINEELSRHVAWGVDRHSMDSPYTKANLLLQAFFSHLPLPISDYYTDTKSVLDQALRILNAMVDVSAEQGWLTTALRTMNLVQMIVQGRWLTDSTLVNLPHFDSQVIDFLWHAGVESLPELMDLPEAEVNRMLARAGLTQRQISRVQNVVKRLPLVDVDWKVTSEKVVVDSLIHLQVNLSRANEPGRRTVRAYTPFFPKPKDEGWWLVAARADTQELVALKRVTMLRGRSKIELEFPAPNSAGSFVYELYLMSDSYLGLDQLYDFSIQVNQSE
eukprot:TRINITY_DN4267_c0_g1_i7.p1 TRINITY_DN4267_c0_g1~~TRINITY_DN4267_c0_g1_i7.p1  ORF type:complete len:582 (-),score=192.11 TRINITY_DN4267_c0_g1_i7:80-1714(-)